MKVLILTGSNPVDIAEALVELRDYHTEETETFSLNVMALLAEETYQRPMANGQESILYGLDYNSFLTIFAKSTATSLPAFADDHHLIVFGNLDKATPLTFDYIVGAPSFKEDTWLAALEEQKNGICPVDWFKVDDAQFCLPSWRQLHLFLDVLGLKQKEEKEKVFDD